MAPADFDKEFDAFLHARYGALLAGMNEWQSQYQAARKAIQGEQWNDAIAPAQRAAELYPEHVGPGSPNLLLARALDKLGRRAEAIAARRSVSQRRRLGSGRAARAGALARRGRTQARMRPTVLQSLNYADPLNPEQHAQLGERLLGRQPRRRFAARIPRAARAARARSGAGALRRRACAARTGRSRGEPSQRARCARRRPALQTRAGIPAADRRGANQK